MDTKTVVHVGLEVAVICGVTVYFHKRVGALEQENQELKKTIEEMKQVIGDHERILRMMIARPGPDEITQRENMRQRDPERMPPQHPQHPRPPQQRQPHPNQDSYPPDDPQASELPPLEEIPPEPKVEVLDDNVLEAELADELQDIETSRSKKMACKDGVCSLDYSEDDMSELVGEGMTNID